MCEVTHLRNLHCFRLLTEIFRHTSTLKLGTGSAAWIGWRYWDSVRTPPRARNSLVSSGSDCLNDLIHDIFGVSSTTEEVMGQRSNLGATHTTVAYVLQLCMSEIASRELRNNTRGLLKRVASGEDIVITVEGQPVAALRTLNLRPRWMNGADFGRRLAHRQADPGLRAELRVLSPDMTDDVPL